MNTNSTLNATDSSNVHDPDAPERLTMSDATDVTESLVTLRTGVIDASKGHAEGAKRSDDPTMTGVFEELHAMHRTHAANLDAALMARGVEPDADGSFMQYVHKAILSVRSAVSALGEGAMSGVRDGEERILSLYDDTLNLASGDAELVDLLTTQRRAVAEEVNRMRELEAKAG